MDISLSAEDEAFRQEVVAFLKDNLTTEMLESGKKEAGVFTDAPINLKWQKILYEKGWVAPMWPKEYGGAGWTPMQNYLFATESAKARAPKLSALGLRMVGPCIIGHGTEEQKNYYLPRILSGEDYWCQGYSEPGSGSDLASLQCKAESDGDDYIVNGTKLWTTHAHFANMIFCLVRTDPVAKPQAGISFLLIDMKTPGITVEPIITMSGDHEVNQVFFDDVRVPKKNCLGAENDGWTVAKYLLEFERGGAAAGPMSVGLGNVRDIASVEQSGDGGSLIEDDAFTSELAHLEIGLTAIEFTEHRIMAEISKTGRPGPESSILKTWASNTSQDISELAVKAIGHYARPFQPEARVVGANVPPIGPDHGLTAVPRYLNNRAATVYGGSDEIQKNIIAKVVLGL